jgi:hypothetical protein
MLSRKREFQDTSSSNTPLTQHHYQQQQHHYPSLTKSNQNNNNSTPPPITKDIHNKFNQQEPIYSKKFPLDNFRGNNNRKIGNSFFDR